MFSDKDQLLSAIRSGDTRLAHELMVQSHFALCKEISSLSEKISYAASRRDVDRALAIFSSLVIASLGLFISIR